jgi:hypothetical protein
MVSMVNMCKSSIWRSARVQVYVGKWPGRCVKLSDGAERMWVEEEIV